MTEDIGGVPEVEEDWMAAMTYATLSLEHLRRIYPSRIMLLPETGHSAIGGAMEQIQGSIARLHRAGKFVLGADRYEQYIREQIHQQREETSDG